MVQKSRREFISMTAAAAATVLVSGKRLLGASSNIQGWVTCKNRKFDSLTGLNWKKSSVASTGAIRLDPAQKRQSVLGFGAALTDASCYLLGRMDAQARETLCNDLFTSAGLKLSVCRTCIGASDYSTKEYTFDDSVDPDPELAKFTIDHDREYILPVLRQATKANPDLFLFSTPWSPPGWMKANNSLLGGSMRKKYLSTYADYFVRFLKDYEAEGVKIKAITVQNEVDTDQDGRMPAALWGQEYEVEFVKKYLGPSLEKAGLDTKIWILDHNYNLWGRVMNELGDPTVNKYVDGVAWHGYVGTPDAMTKIHDEFPTKNMYWTEGGPVVTSPDYATEWTKWGDTIATVFRNWAECFVGWNLVLDEKGKPNIGPFACGGLVTVDSQTGQVTKSGQYWAFMHYSKMVQRGAQVLASDGDITGVSHVAFENPDNTHILVVNNKGAKQTVPVQLGTQAFDLPLEEDSITTIQW